MARVGLRPQAEGAQRRAAARGVEGDERVQQERNVVARDVQIALVDLGHPGQRVQIFDGRPFRVVDHAAVLAEAHAGQLLERLALGVIGDLVIELAPHHEIDGLVRQQRLFRLDGHRRPHEGHLQLRVDVLHHLGHLHVHVKAGSGGVQHQKLELLGHLHGLLDGDLVRRRVHHFAVGQHARGIAEPHRIPVGFDFARGRPARTGAAVEAFERRRIQKSVLIDSPAELPAPDAAPPTAFRRRPRLAVPQLPSMEKLVKSMVNSALPDQPRLHHALHAAGHRNPISYFIIADELDALQKNRRILHQAPGFPHAQVGGGVDPDLALEQALAASCAGVTWKTWTSRPFHAALPLYLNL